MNTPIQKLFVRFFVRQNTLYCRTTYNGQRCSHDFSIGERVKPPHNPKKVADGEWDVANQQVKGGGPEATVINMRLESIRATIKGFALDLANKGKSFTANTLKDLFTGRDKLHYSLLEVSQKHMAYLERLPKDEIAQGTISTYRTRYKSLESFLTVRGLTKITCEEFSPTIARDYINYMRTERLPRLSQNTAGKHLDLVRGAIKFSINQEWTKLNPLQAFVVKKAKHQMPPYLSEEERYALQNKTFAIKRLQQIKDIFLFCCHTGLSFADVQIFRASQHLRPGKKGEIWLEMKRIKTGIDFYVPLTAVAQDILHQYGGEQLPVPSNVRFNAYLKEVQDLCGIKTKLTVRVARTTFGIVMLNDMNLDLESVSKMLGHANTNITQKHYTQVLKRKIVQNLVTNNPLLYETTITAPTVRPAQMNGFRMVKPLATIQLE